MSDSVRPHRRQPTRLPCPRDSPGKNTRVGCHFQRMKVKSESEVAQSCLTLSNLMDCSPSGSSIYRIFQARVLEWVAITLASHISYDFILSFLLDFCITCTLLGLPQWLSGKESVCNAGEKGSIPGLGRNLGGGHGSPFQYSCLEIPMDRGAWWATVLRVTQSWTRLGIHAI